MAIISLIVLLKGNSPYIDMTCHSFTDLREIWNVTKFLPKKNAQT